MKKLSFLFSALVAFGMIFTSCNPNGDEPGNIDNIVEDGFYVVGEATAFATLQSEGASASIMSVGINENDGQKERAGMYEKYIALEGGKPFQLVLKEGEVETIYGAELAEVVLDGANDQVNATILRGKMVEGATMQVAENGLYHIVLDLNLDNQLSDKLILIAPVEWGYRGINGNWGFTALKTPEFNKTSMTYVSEEITVEAAGEFKFAYSGGWKIELNTAEEAGEGIQVKANTNLGNNADADGKDLMPNDLKPGGKNIKIARGIWEVRLTWNLANGSVGESFTAELVKKGDLEVPNPATFLVGLSGSDFAAAWADPQGDTQAIFNEAETVVSNQETLAGTYVYDIANVAMSGEFKFRYNGAWLGVGAVVVEGTTFGGTDNYIVEEAGNYSIKFIVTWNGEAATEIKAVFTKL